MKAPPQRAAKHVQHGVLAKLRSCKRVRIWSSVVVRENWKHCSPLTCAAVITEEVGTTEATEALPIPTLLALLALDHRS
eukprot:924628-Amphidinium_carterae.1